jgi:hypothetical protein
MMDLLASRDDAASHASEKTRSQVVFSGSTLDAGQFLFFEEL